MRYTPDVIHTKSGYLAVVRSRSGKIIWKADYARLTLYEALEESEREANEIEIWGV